MNIQLNQLASQWPGTLYEDGTPLPKTVWANRASIITMLTTPQQWTRPLLGLLLQLSTPAKTSAM